VIAAWGVGLLTVVGVALVGGGIGTEEVAHPSTPAAAAGSSLGTRTAAAPDTASAAIFLDTPATSSAVITTRDLVVRGRVRPGMGPVQVMLESAGSQMVVRTVDPATLPADQDRSQRPAFFAILPVPTPRPIGPAVVHVIAYDATGQAQEIVVRTIEIRDLLDPTYGDEAARPPTGEDGLMGGIPFGTNFAWMADDR
jgi:hypothetical protein